jgi:hypothetical protein
MQIKKKKVELAAIVSLSPALIIFFKNACLEEVWILYLDIMIV